jgi:multidrug resistance protein, MATE family
MSIEAKIETPHAVKNLTKYPSGSVRELWCISLPLMLSLMSSSLMLFLDRMFLAQYSLDAFTASVNGGIMAATIQFGFISTACIAEVFVGQYNGRGQHKKIGQPVWQMIWLSIFSTFIFLPAAFLATFYFPQSTQMGLYETSFFQWLMIFGPFFCISGALTAFFVGRGKVKFVTVLMIVANLINIGLDILLIFGLEPYVSSMGVAGAAIATGTAQIFQCVVLFIVFICEKNRRLFGTGIYNLNKKIFFDCIKVGLPNSLAHTIEIFAWAIFFRMMTNMGTEYITVVSIAQSIFVLFTFVTEGVSKGATAIAANLIGARKWDLVWKLLSSGIKFYFQIFIVLGFVLVINPEPLIQWFMPEGLNALNPEIKRSVISACFWVWVFFLFDGIMWLIIGLLTAAGDTKFILQIGGTTVWIFGILPVYFLINVYGMSPEIAWAVTAFYGLVTCCIYLWRFHSEKWKKVTI